MSIQYRSLYSQIKLHPRRTSIVDLPASIMEMDVRLLKRAVYTWARRRGYFVSTNIPNLHLTDRQLAVFVRAQDVYFKQEDGRAERRSKARAKRSASVLS